MGTVAPTDEKQALADELGRARALIDQREFVAALDRLERVRDAASAQRDTRALSEVRELARLVHRQTLGGSPVGDRADALVAGVTFDLDPDAVGDGARQSGAMSATTWLWCGRVAIALGIAQAAVFVAFGAASAGTRVLFAVVVVAGAVIARRHPALIGGLLIFFGLIVIPILVWAINFAHGWATEPTSWGFWEYFWLVTIGGVPLLAAGLLLLSARADGVGQDVSNQYRHSALGQDTKSMWPSP